jgi:hypothetical protein
MLSLGLGLILTLFIIYQAYSGEAPDQSANTNLEIDLYSLLIDQYLHHNVIKKAMISSQSQNLRHEAARAMMKIAYVGNFRE